HRLSRSMEPRAATPKRRLDAVRQLTAAGVPTTVMFAPSIPSLNDHEMEAVLEAAAAAGATTAGYVAVRLPLEIKDLFEEWLAAQGASPSAEPGAPATRAGMTVERGWAAEGANPHSAECRAAP